MFRGTEVKLKLNLFENSHDYIISSLDLYKEADEHGTHDEQRSNFNKKVKWKLAFVTLVQAVELLLKEILRRINCNLIYENIDVEHLNESKTVSFNQAIIRINNMSDKNIPEKIFLINCSKFRNQFIHYEMNTTSEEIKSKYCQLFHLYIEIHRDFLKEEISYSLTNNKRTVDEILDFNKNYEIFRGSEIRKEQLIVLKKEIEENESYQFLITKDGKKINRIRYGEEKKYFSKHNPDYQYDKETDTWLNQDPRDYSSYEEFQYCGDCLAKQGEYHLDNCDWEVCPVCGRQLISCDCIKEFSTE